MIGAFLYHAPTLSSTVFGFIAWSLLPYIAISFFLIEKPHGLYKATFAGVFVLAANMASYYTAFYAPQGSTSALGVLVIPLFNLLVLAPMGSFFGNVIGESRRLKNEKLEQ